MQTTKHNRIPVQPYYTYGKSMWRSYLEGIEREWIITNGIGGYANLTVIGSNSRSFSGLLTTSFNPPTDRFTVLGNITECVYFESSDETYDVVDLSTNHLIDETVQGQKYLSHFDYDSYPSFTYQIQDCIITKKIGMAYGENATCICYTIKNGARPATFCATPQFTYKPLGNLVNPSDLQFSIAKETSRLTLIPKNSSDTTIYFDVSEGSLTSRNSYPSNTNRNKSEYQVGILYDLDIRNGLNVADSFYTPYDLLVELKPYETKSFYCICSTTGNTYNGFEVLEQMDQRKLELEKKLPYDDALLKRLSYSADAFIVHRKSTNCKTVLAGYPWFLDWGRDTMIAFTGLTLCTHRFEEAESILLSFAKYVNKGLLPNVFPDTSNDQPQYNTIDASLWYFYAVYEYLQYNNTKQAKEFITDHIYPVLEQIIEYYSKGTDFSIHVDEDHLLSGGSDLDQITWMDVRVGEWVVTPRHGKPVEINALWYNALKVMEFISPEDKKKQYRENATSVKESFIAKFWNESEDCLYDVISKNKDGIEEGDPSVRPNQLVAVSLPFTMLESEQEAKIVKKALATLYTPLGIRSLSPESSEYHSKYIGKLHDRDAAYHMGTSWGYVTGPFMTAYLKVNNYSKDAIETAKQLLLPLIDHLSDGCLGGVAEVFDGDFPCTSRGCYTQAWSVGELIRVYVEDILAHEA